MKGILLVTMEAPSALDEEFNDWYDTEHLPERRAIDGFETAQRFASVAGWPKYVATYDLRSVDVLVEAGYRGVSGDHFSPWSKRILSKVRGQWRYVGVQMYPGDALLDDAARLLLIRYRHVPRSAWSKVVDAVRATFEDTAGTRQVRVFRDAAEDAADLVALVEATQPFGAPSGPAFSGEVAQYLCLINEYGPYWTRGSLHGVFPDAKA